LTVGNLILSVEEVPAVKETILACQKEKTSTGRRPAAVSKVRVVVSSLHDGGFEIIIPDLGRPITDRQEVFAVKRVSLKSVNWTVMFTLFNTISVGDLNVILSLGSLKNVTLLGTDKIFKSVLRNVFKRGCTKNLRLKLAIDVDIFFEGKLLNWTFTKFLHIPPKDSTISRGGDNFSTGLGSMTPKHIINWVVVRLLKDSSLSRPKFTAGVTLSLIKECKRTIVGTTDDQFIVLVVESHSAKRGSRFKSLLRVVRVFQIPNVSRLSHVRRHLLESQSSVRYANTLLGGIRMPCDFSDSSLHSVRVLENRNRFGRDGLRQILRAFTAEVLLEQINLVVLAEALHGTLDEVMGSSSVTKRSLSVKLFLILDLVSSFSVIKLLRPTTSYVSHFLFGGRNSFGVNSMLGHLRDVIKSDLVRVSLNIKSLLVGFTVPSTDNLGLGIFEDSVSTEFVSLF